MTKETEKYTKIEFSRVDLSLLKKTVISFRGIATIIVLFGAQKKLSNLTASKFLIKLRRTEALSHRIDLLLYLRSYHKFGAPKKLSNLTASKFLIKLRQTEAFSLLRS